MRSAWLLKIFRLIPADTASRRVFCWYKNPGLVPDVYKRQSLTPLPDNVSFEEAAMCDTAGVAFHGLERAGVTPGGTVCVIGPGPIGLMSMKIARCLGAAHVIAVGRGARLKAAVATGACDPDKAIDFEACERDGVDVVQKVVEMTDVYKRQPPELLPALPFSLRCIP